MLWLFGVGLSTPDTCLIPCLNHLLKSKSLRAEAMFTSFSTQLCVIAWRASVKDGL